MFLQHCLPDPAPLQSPLARRCGGYGRGEWGRRRRLVASQGHGHECVSTEHILYRTHYYIYRLVASQWHGHECVYMTHVSSSSYAASHMTHVSSSSYDASQGHGHECVSACVRVCVRVCVSVCVSVSYEEEDICVMSVCGVCERERENIYI